MAIYTNPTGTFDATTGDDTIIFNTKPAGIGTAAAIDAIGGHDSLIVQVPNGAPMSFDASDRLNTGAFTAQVSFGPFDAGIVVYNVESVEYHGGSANDTFNLVLGSNPSGLSAIMDGGAGDDLLKFDWSKLTTGVNFVLSGSSIVSTFGSFTNFERFEIRAGSGNDTIVTGAGNDNIYTGTGTDNVSTGAGNDFINSESSGGTVDGGDGVDFYNGNFSAGSAPLSVTIGASTQISNGITISNVESISIGGGSGDDQFSVTRVQISGALYGGAGHDTLVFNAPSTTGLQFSVVAYDNDQLDGQISVDQGNFQTFAHFENVSFTGTAFNDLFQIRADYSASTSAFSFDGAGGTDTLLADFSLFTGGTTLTVGADSSVSSNRGQFAHIETFRLTGGSSADTFVTGSGDDTLIGGTGADYLDGGAGNDFLYSVQSVDQDDGVRDVLVGGLGDDTIAGGFGDTVDGGAGVDKLYYTASTATAGINADFSFLAAGGTISIGGTTLTGIEQIAQVTGSSFGDTIIAGGTIGAQLFGRGGDDRIVGTSRADSIWGGEGNDTLSGGAGLDTLMGGDGRDTFIDTAANLNGDTIDMTLDDTIVISDADIASFSFSVTGNTLTYTGGTLSLLGGIPGHLVATAAANGGVQLQVALPPVATIDQIASQLTTGFWNGGAHHFDVTQGGTITVDISTLNPTEQALARAALAEWADVMGIYFQEVTSGAQILFDHSEDGTGHPVAATDAVWSNGITSSAHIQISTSWVNQNGSDFGSYSFQTYLHEIGHALGLGHAGNYNQTAVYQNDALFQNDSIAVSIMSYFDQSESYYFANQHFSIDNVVTPMQADILAIQSLYGLSTTTRTGDTIYGYNSNAGFPFGPNTYAVAYTIFDNGGNDTLDYSLAGGVQLINLNPETFSNVGGIGNLSIARGTIIENAIGSTGPDTLIGNAADNILTGNLGSDTLTGGAGNDTFKDTVAGHNGDTIVDFSSGDRILFTDANIGNFTFSLSGNTLTFTGGSIALTAVPQGTLVASAAPGGGVQLTLATHVANDFNGDGISDIMWRDASGTMSEWLGQANGGFQWNAAAGFNVGTDWSMLGFGDFNGDGASDILWRQSGSGIVTEWLATAGGSFSSNASYALPATYELAALGDFNGDGRQDIMWRGQDGTLSEWLGQSTGGFQWNANAAIQVGTDWKVIGAGDFNGDGKDDLLWRQDNSGTVMEWFGNAQGGFAWTANYELAAGFHLVGTGDFNGDHLSDIMWRSSDGTLSEWLARSNGTFQWNANAAYPVANDQHIIGVGDYNHDHIDDLLWESDSGHVSQWLGQSNGAFAWNQFVQYEVGPAHLEAQPLSDHLL